MLTAMFMNTTLSRPALLTLFALTTSALGACTSDPPAGDEGMTTTTQGMETDSESSSSESGYVEETGSEDEGSDTSSETETGTETDTEDTETDTEDTETDTGAMPDCENLPQLPIPYVLREGPRGSEDFVFDTEGNLVNIVDGGNLFLSPHEGMPMLSVPGVGSNDASGTAALSNGDIVFADSGWGRVVRVDGDGVTETLASGISYPNGLTVDMEDNIYVSEHDGGQVLMINPATKEVTTIADGLFNPNGLAFDSKYEKLYIGSFGGGTVHQYDVLTGETVEYANNIGDSGLDGVIVDLCDNVYVTDYGPGLIWRVDPEGDVTLAVDISNVAFWIPNMHFGSGIGGWDENILYVIDRSENQVYEVDLGIGGIKLPHLGG